MCMLHMLAGTCVHRWLGVVPLSRPEERQSELTFVMSMLLISAHVRAALKERQRKQTQARMLTYADVC